MAGSKTVLAPPEVPGSDPAPLGAPVCEIQETALRPEASGRMADARDRAMARPGPLAAPGLDPGAAPWGSGKPPSGPRLVRQPQPSLSFARPTSALICGLHGACAPLTSGIAVSGQAGHDACGQVRAGRQAASARRRARPPRRRTASCLRAAGGPDARLRPGSRRLPAAGSRSGAPRRRLRPEPACAAGPHRCRQRCSAERVGCGMDGCRARRPSSSGSSVWRRNATMAASSD